jgi:hypothetical protein
MHVEHEVSTPLFRQPHKSLVISYAPHRIQLGALPRQHEAGRSSPQCRKVILEIAEELVHLIQSPQMMSVRAQELSTKLEGAAIRFDGMTNWRMKAQAD